MSGNTIAPPLTKQDRELLIRFALFKLRNYCRMLTESPEKTLEVRLEGSKLAKAVEEVLAQFEEFAKL